jgi:hypothetical protein
MRNNLISSEALFFSRHFFYKIGLAEALNVENNLKKMLLFFAGIGAAEEIGKRNLAKLRLATMYNSTVAHDYADRTVVVLSHKKIIFR